MCCVDQLKSQPESGHSFRHEVTAAFDAERALALYEEVSEFSFLLPDRVADGVQSWCVELVTASATFCC